MLYKDEEVLKAFRIYALLARTGEADTDHVLQYENDDRIRGLVEQFASEVECTTLVAGQKLHMIPLVRLSPFHMNNDTLKRKYLPAGATNIDLYLTYVAIIVFIGAFYDSYQTLEPTRNFLRIGDWLDLIQERIDSLKQYEPEELEQHSRDYLYQWTGIINRWDALDDVKENVKRQVGRVNSRLSFLDTVRRFLESQQLIKQIGADEWTLTEKAKTIVQRYFMEIEHNRGILEFLYQYASSFEGEDQHANN